MTIKTRARQRQSRQPAADRHLQRRQLRLHRRTRQRPLSAPLPRRLLHPARRQQPDRAARRPHHRRDAGQRLRGPHRRHPLQRLRRFQPRGDDPAQGAGDRHRGRRPRDRRGADQPPAPVPAAERACCRHRRDDRKTMADLGRDRLQCRRPRESGARDPPGGQLRLRPPLHRRPARPPQRRRRRNRSAGRVPLLPRQRALQAGRDQRPPQAFQGASSRPCTRPGSTARTSTWPGTSPSPATRTTPAASSRCATTPSPSSATPTSPT